MRSSRWVLEVAAATACLLLGGCAGPGWISADSLAAAGKIAEPERPATAKFTKPAALQAEKHTAAKPPVANESKPAEESSPVVEAIKSRGDLDEQTKATLEQTLRESDPAVRDLLLQTLLAATKEKATPAQPKKLVSDAEPSKETSPALPAKRQADPPVAKKEVAEKEVAPASANVPEPTLPTTPQPLPTTPPSWQDELDKTIGALEKDLADKSLPADERSRMEAQLRLLYLAADRRAQAVEPIPGESTARQEFWKSQLHAMAILLDQRGPPNSERRSALALRYAREAADHLAAGSTLDVRNLAFVSRVDSYGRYTEFPKMQFRPDQEVLLYVEVDNLSIESKREGYETAIEGSYQILDATGTRVADHAFPEEKETCRRPRRDFFIGYRLYMPKAISPGDYTLQLTIKDVKGNKFGQGRVKFAIER